MTISNMWFTAPHTIQPMAHGPMLIINTELFQDSSPFVAESDAVGSESLNNGYTFVLSIENFPAAVQTVQFENRMDWQEWDAANKRFLTDRECEDFLNVLATQAPDIEEAWHLLDGDEPPV